MQQAQSRRVLYVERHEAATRVDPGAAFVVEQKVAGDAHAVPSENA
jgi:hypothetical protein